MKRLAEFAVFACAATAGAATMAEPIYRCAGADGPEYSHIPCPGGKVLESSDPRSAAQRAEAARVAAQERRQAAALERERRAQQAGMVPTRATSLSGPPKAAEAASAAERGKTSQAKSKRSKADKNDKSADFVAVEPGTPKKKKKP
jgi:hypothetical protein